MATPVQYENVLPMPKQITSYPRRRIRAGAPPIGAGIGLDYFTNAAARIGGGTPSLGEGADYYLDRVSNNYSLLSCLYRNSWLPRRIVDSHADDMTRAWPKLNTELEPTDIKAFDRTIDRTQTQHKINTAIKWARLFGGAGALIVLRGHEKMLEEPLDLDQVNPGAYCGLIPFDRWSGIMPSNELASDIEDPLTFGLPEMYEVRNAQTSASFNVHASRVLRFCGPEVPQPELQAQMHWGISVLELVYEELKKRDNTSWSILNLLFRANILGKRDPELAQILSGAVMGGQGLQRWEKVMQAQNELLSNQSMVILGKEGEMFSHQYSFSGLEGILQQFMLDMCGAARTPATRLFGRTITGLGQSNDGDERIYEETIAQEQMQELDPNIKKLYPVVMMSEFGETPKDWDITYPSIRVLTEEDKKKLAKDGTDAVVVAFNAGLISPRVATKELQQMADTTGFYSNITPEDIEAASPKLQQMGEMDLGGGEAGEQPEPEAEAQPEPSEHDMRQLKDLIDGQGKDAAVFIGSPLETKAKGEIKPL